jgi:hypothetical protein
MASGSAWHANPWKGDWVVGRERWYPVAKILSTLGILTASESMKVIVKTVCPSAAGYQVPDHLREEGQPQESCSRSLPQTVVPEDASAEKVA